MKFETILEAFEGVIEGMERTDYLGDDWLCDKHTRQRDAFRARLEKMYEELNYRKNWYRIGHDPLPRG